MQEVRGGRMSERVERNSLYFKLAVFALVAMFATIPLRYLLPAFAPLLPDDPAGMRVGFLVAMFALQFLIFVFFLRAARLLLCTFKALALLFAIDGVIVLAIYVVRSDRGDDQLLLTFLLMPMTIAASYYAYCTMRKLV
jgi:hypothetical protein